MHLPSMDARRMEDKSVLESQLRELKYKMDCVDREIVDIQRDIANVRRDKELHITKAQEDAEAQAAAELNAQLVKVDKCVSDTLLEVEKFIDNERDKTISNSPLQDCKGLDTSKLMNPLYELYPDGFIDNYVLYNPIVFKDSGTLRSHYDKSLNSCKSMLYSVSTASLYKATTIMLSNLDSKQLLAVVCVVVALSIFVPWVPMVILCLSAVVGLASGYVNNRLLRDVFSVKTCLEDSYDMEAFEADKSDLLEKSKEYLESVADEYRDEIQSSEPNIDTQDMEDRIAEDCEKQESRYKVRLQSARDMLSHLRAEISKVQEQLSAIDAHNKELAAQASKLYLDGVSLGNEWLDSVYLGNRQDDSIVMHPMHKTPTLFISSNINALFSLAKLIIYQVMIRVNPDVVSQVFIDHKYVGGDLQALFRVPSGRFPVALKEDDINTRLDFIGADIFSRVNNILSTCSGLDEFNTIMGKYGSAGESYVVVHVFGLSKLGEVYSNLLRNGSKVGYFLYLYVTVDELKDLEPGNLLTQFPNIYVVKEFPTAVTTDTVLKMLMDS